MGVGRFDGHAVMARARGDEEVGRGSGFPGSTAAARQLAGFFPDFVGDFEFGEMVFKSSQRLPFFVTIHACPKFQPNDGAPGGLTRFDKLTHSGSDRLISLFPQGFYP